MSNSTRRRQNREQQNREQFMKHTRQKREKFLYQRRHRMDEIRDEIRVTPVSMNIDNNFILARVSQNDDLHQEITPSLNRFFVGTGRDPNLNFRFATYYVNLIEEEPYLRIYLIDTIAIDLQAWVLYNDLVDDGREDGVQLLLNQLLIKKIINELLILGYRLDGSDLTTINATKPNNLVISVDAYYNRGQESAGLFHQDRLPNNNDPLHNPLYVSLEYFIETNTIILGPEIILMNPDEYNPPNDGIYNYTGIQNALRVRQPQSQLHNMSIRTPIINGSIIIFNNVSAIHATPTVERSDFLPQELPELSRYRVQNLPNFAAREVVTNTQNVRRSFLRMWFSNGDQINIDTVNSREIVAQFVGDTLDNARRQYQLQLPQQITLNQLAGSPVDLPILPNYIIFGDANNPIIKINTNVSYEYVNDDDVEKYLIKEEEFLKQINQQKKGGKRKHRQQFKKRNKTRKGKKSSKNRRSSRRKIINI